MPLNSQQLRALICLLLIACCAFSRLWTAVSADERLAGDRTADILAGNEQHVTAVLAKNVTDVFRLSRREFVTEWWLPVICQNANRVSASSAATLHFSSHQILCEFARREVAGVLLS